MESFVPGALDVAGTIPSTVCHRSITFAERQGFRPLQLDVYVPIGAERPPVVVWIHGGAFWEGDRRGQPAFWGRPSAHFRAILEAGLAVATVDYRLSGEAVWPAQLDDVTAAVRFVRLNADALGVDRDRVGVAGDSAGGHLAGMVALTVPEVRAAALLYPVTDLRDFDHVAGLTPDEYRATPEGCLMGCLPDEDPQRWHEASPINRVHAGAPPILLVHGEADVVVPARQSVRMAQALDAAGARDVVLDLVPGADHCFGGVDEEGPLRRVAAFLADRLR